MDIYNQIALKIIEQQESIIGLVAIEQAARVPSIVLDWPKHVVKITGDGAAAIDKLVVQYKKLFGQLSVEVCRDAAAQLVAQLPADKQPKTLK